VAEPTTDHQAPVSAVVSNERVLATAAVVSRLGGCVFLLTALLAGTSQVLALAALVESAVLVAACWAAGRVRVWWTVVDALTSVMLFLLGAPLYNYVLVAVLLIGIAPLRLRWTVLLGSAVVAAYVVSALLRHGNPVNPVNPLWNVGPDAASMAGMPVVAWLMASQIRSAARRIDARRAEAVRRAADVAAEWERARQSAELRARLLRLLDELADVVSEPVRAQIADEASWLRGFVSGDTPAGTDLRAALCAIADDRRSSGVDVTVDIDGELPDLPPERMEAVTGAVWEALTNVVKHAGTDRATVRAHVGTEGLVVEVADTGQGFDPARTSGGTGLRGSIRRRLLDVGGSVVVESAPGRGTVVRMSIPDMSS
jgi:signal transduction histidine kinase